MAVSTVTEIVPIEMGSDGVVRVGRTRVTLDSIVAAFCEGSTAEEIAQQYSAVPLADVYAVIAYYLRRSPEIEAYFGLRRQQAEQVRQENESRFPPLGIRERLLARRRSRIQLQRFSVV